MTTSLLDLAGVFLLGLVGALAVTTVQSQPPPSIVRQIADAVGLGDLSSQGLVIALASIAAALLLIKSVVSSVLNRRIFMFLANRQALVSARLTKALLSRPLVEVQATSSQETSFALIQGAGAATITILGQSTILVTEASLLILLGIGLTFVAPLLSLGSIAFFALLAVALYRVMGKWATQAGIVASTADIASLNSVQEAISAYREITVLDRRDFYVTRVQKQRWEAARSAADRQFMTMFPKYIFEAALVLGGFLLATVLFTTQEAVAAIGTLALFLAAGTRIMPSILRLQSAALSLRSGASIAEPTFRLAERLDNPVSDPYATSIASVLRDRLGRDHMDFTPSIDVAHLSVSYPGAAGQVLADVSLQVRPGSSLAIIGPSGAGKSTLADAILGVVDADAGAVLVGGRDPKSASARWPGAIAYVPQNVAVADGTIRDNVALGLPAEAVDDQRAWEALVDAHLAAYLEANREGLDTLVGESGLRLSGGQRQRLGIARALYTRPRLIVFDEATSSLDAETEHLITSMLRDLEGKVTLVVIAHRLSTVKHSDTVAYLERGRLVASGSFEEIRSTVPALERQARLMGL